MTQQKEKTQKEKTQKEETIDIIRLTEERITVCILGRTPLICNRMSEKAKRELLMPRRKTAADRAANLKHDPLAEYRASAYLADGDDSPTRLQVFSTAFKDAICSAALDIPGAAKKAVVGRLTWVDGRRIDIYGVPKLFMTVVRLSDIRKTPDIRTRVIVPEWACKVSILFTTPVLRATDVINLLVNAGLIRGIGDWRQELGSESYGQFEIVDADDPRYLKLLESGGRVEQDAALENPAPFDTESAEMFGWFTDEAARRGFKVVA
jgi:hypothetical protein